MEAQAAALKQIQCVPGSSKAAGQQQPLVATSTIPLTATMVAGVSISLEMLLLSAVMYGGERLAVSRSTAVYQFQQVKPTCPSWMAPLSIASSLWRFLSNDSALHC